jgi:hypothetical protein
MDDEVVTQAMRLHAARNHPGSGHYCGQCLRDAQDDRLPHRGRWLVAMVIAAVVTVWVVWSVIPAAHADPEPPAPGSVTISRE